MADTPFQQTFAREIAEHDQAQQTALTASEEWSQYVRSTLRGPKYEYGYSQHGVPSPFAGLGVHSPKYQRGFMEESGVVGGVTKAAGRLAQGLLVDLPLDLSSLSGQALIEGQRWAGRGWASVAERMYAGQDVFDAVWGTISGREETGPLAERLKAEHEAIDTITANHIGRVQGLFSKAKEAVTEFTDPAIGLSDRAEFINAQPDDLRRYSDASFWKETLPELLLSAVSNVIFGMGVGAATKAITKSAALAASVSKASTALSIGVMEAADTHENNIRQLMEQGYSRGDAARLALAPSIVGGTLAGVVERGILPYQFSTAGGAARRFAVGAAGEITEEEVQLVIQELAGQTTEWLAKDGIEIDSVLLARNMIDSAIGGLGGGPLAMVRALDYRPQVDTVEDDKMHPIIQRRRSEEGPGSALQQVNPRGSKMHRMVERVAGLLGREVVWFSGAVTNGGVTATGFVYAEDAEHGKTIALNVGLSSMDAMAGVLFHEFVHTTEGTSPWDRLVQWIIDNDAENLEKYARVYWEDSGSDLSFEDWFNSTKEKGLEEGAAAYVENNFYNTNFWKRIAGMDGGLWDQIVEWFRRRLSVLADTDAALFQERFMQFLDEVKQEEAAVAEAGGAAEADTTEEIGSEAPGAEPTGGVTIEGVRRDGSARPIDPIADRVAKRFGMTREQLLALATPTEAIQRAYNKAVWEKNDALANDIRAVFRSISAGSPSFAVPARDKSGQPHKPAMILNLRTARGRVATIEVNNERTEEGLAALAARNEYVAEGSTVSAGAFESILKRAMRRIATPDPTTGAVPVTELAKGVMDLLGVSYDDDFSLDAQIPGDPRADKPYDTTGDWTSTGGAGTYKGVASLNLRIDLSRIEDQRARLLTLAILGDIFQQESMGASMWEAIAEKTATEEQMSAATWAVPLEGLVVSRLQMEQIAQKLEASTPTMADAFLQSEQVGEHSVIYVSRPFESEGAVDRRAFERAVAEVTGKRVVSAPVSWSSDFIMREGTQDGTEWVSWTNDGEVHYNLDTLLGEARHGRYDRGGTAASETGGGRTAAAADGGQRLARVDAAIRSLRETSAALQQDFSAYAEQRARGAAEAPAHGRHKSRFYHISRGDRSATGLQRIYAGTGAVGQEARYLFNPDGTVNADRAVVHLYTARNKAEWQVMSKASYVHAIEMDANLAADDSELVASVVAKHKAEGHRGIDLSIKVFDTLKEMGFDGYFRREDGRVQMFRDIEPHEIIRASFMHPELRKEIRSEPIGRVQFARAKAKSVKLNKGQEAARKRMRVTPKSFLDHLERYEGGVATKDDIARMGRMTDAQIIAMGLVPARIRGGEKAALIADRIDRMFEHEEEKRGKALSAREIDFHATMASDAIIAGYMSASEYVTTLRGVRDVGIEEQKSIARKAINKASAFMEAATASPETFARMVPVLTVRLGVDAASDTRSHSPVGGKFRAESGEEIEAILARHPLAMKDEQATLDFFVDLYRSSTVPVPPMQLIHYVRTSLGLEKTEGVRHKDRKDLAARKGFQYGQAEWLLSRMTEAQKAAADSGLELTMQYAQAYADGSMSVIDTIALALWGSMSKQLSAFVHEGAAMKVLFDSEFRALLERAARGEDIPWRPLPEWKAPKKSEGYTKAEVRAMKEAFDEEKAAIKARNREWLEPFADRILKGETVVSGATSNLNAFLDQFLGKLSQRRSDGRTHLMWLHDQFADQSMNGRELRRRLMVELPDGHGISLKVWSFLILLSGRHDVMVLDRWQLRQLWDDGRFKADDNLYSGMKEEPSDTATEEERAQIKARNEQKLGGLAALIESSPKSLAMYEAIERALEDMIPRAFANVGIDAPANLGYFHWYTWNAISNQDATHDSLMALLGMALGDEAMVAKGTSLEGRANHVEFGALYTPRADGRRGSIEYTIFKGDPEEATFYFDDANDFRTAINYIRNQYISKILGDAAERRGYLRKNWHKTSLLNTAVFPEVAEAKWSDLEYTDPTIKFNREKILNALRKRATSEGRRTVPADVADAVADGSRSVIQFATGGGRLRSVVVHNGSVAGRARVAVANYIAKNPKATPQEIGEAVFGAGRKEALKETQQREVDYLSELEVLEERYRSLRRARGKDINEVVDLKEERKFLRRKLKAAVRYQDTLIKRYKTELKGDVKRLVEKRTVDLKHQMELAQRDRRRLEERLAKTDKTYRDRIADLKKEFGETKAEIRRVERARAHKRVLVAKERGREAAALARKLERERRLEAIDKMGKEYASRLDRMKKRAADREAERQAIAEKLREMHRKMPRGARIFVTASHLQATTPGQMARAIAAMKKGLNKHRKSAAVRDFVKAYRRARRTKLSSKHIEHIRTLTENVRTSKVGQKQMDAVEAAKALISAGVLPTIPSNIAHIMDQMTRQKLSGVSAETLETLTKAINAVLKSQRDATKLISEGRKVDIDTRSQMLGAAIRKRFREEDRDLPTTRTGLALSPKSIAEKALSLTGAAGLLTANSETVASYIAESEENDLFAHLHGDLAEANEARLQSYYQFHDFVFNLLAAQGYALGSKELAQMSRTLVRNAGTVHTLTKSGERTWVADERRVVLEDGSEIILSPMELIALRNTLRDQHTLALIRKGARVAIENDRSLTYEIADGDIMTIENALSDSERAVADGMLTFINTVGRDMMNTYSERAFGYAIADRFVYWMRHRIGLDPAEVTNVVKFHDTAMSSAGIAQQRTEDYTKPILVRDALMDFVNYGWVSSGLLHMERVVSRNHAVMHSTEMEQVLDGRANGRAVRNYYDRLHREIISMVIGGVHDSTVAEQWMNKVVRGVTVGALGLNIPVMLYQFASVAAASTEIEASYVYGNLQAAADETIDAEINQYSPVLRHRSGVGPMGFLTEGSASLASTAGVRSSGDYLMMGISGVDRRAIRVIWAASKAKVRRTQPGLKGEDLLRATSKMATQIVLRTQPTNDPLTATGLGNEARRKPFIKGMVMFFSQRAKNVSIMYRAILKAQRGEISTSDAAKKIGSVFVLQSAMIALVKVMMRGLLTGLEPPEEEGKQFALDIMDGVLGNMYFGNAAAMAVKRFMDPEAGAFGRDYEFSPAASTLADGITSFSTLAGELGKAAWGSGTEPSKVIEALERMMIAGAQTAGVPVAPYRQGKKFITNRVLQ